ncbi:hypothetical protein RND81_08G033500 [Saponaria officinalis]|uniref:Ubiquinone biosynthesis protein n=1 Tax=Saponaria officinalis TaxID=3572 RepID=A0AAW1J3D8_SAPOF
MYRTAANRLFLHTLRRTTTTTTLPYTTTTNLPKTTSSSSLYQFYTTSSSPSSSNLSFSPQNPNPNHSDKSEPSDSSSPSSSEEGRRRRTASEYQEEQTRVLHASLHHVNRLGWGEEAMMAGAREVGVSPSIVGSFPKKDAALVEFFMDDCLERILDIIESDEELKNLIPSERIAKLVKARLEMQAPFITKWHQALGIQAMPANVTTSFKQRATLVNEIWHAAGDDSSDLDWYVKRTMLGGIYSTTEVYMLTDKSPDYRDTWAFLNSRVRDAFDLKKTLQEAQYLAEAVSAGFGGSFQGLVKGFKG